MVKLAGYHRTATFAWSHDRIPQIVTGTASGTIDANFSNESVLELWSLLSAEPDKPIASLSSDAKFNDLDWSIDNQLIAGALENGTVEFFKLNKNNNSNNNSTNSTSIESVGKFNNFHNSTVNTIKFNPKQANVLISGDNSGEIFVWDTEKAIHTNTASTNGAAVQGYTPMKPGTAMTSIEEIHSLAWNQSLAHVFASAGSSSFASIWDLKAKKEVIHLSYTSPVTGLKPQLSVVEWHPTNSTKLATATGSDTEPAIVIWDLRNANTPLTTLVNGHSKGILCLDWCNQDEDLLLSSGCDNTVVLWNPTTGEQLTQYPPHGNWLFKTKFAPQAPDIFATASFDAKIEIQTLQNLVNELDKKENVTKQQESETEFWTHISQQESIEKPAVKKIQAPAWYSNHSPAATWAFGGKLVSIGEDGKSVNITKPVLPGLEQNILLNEALKSKDFKPLINVRLVKGIDKNNEDDWNLLDKLSMDGRDEFLRDTFTLDDDDVDDGNDNENGNKDSTNDDKMNTEAGEEFFEKIESEFKPTDPFKLEKDTDFSITRKLISGNTKAVITEALQNDLLLESLIVALDSNDTTLKEKVKNHYFKKLGNSNSLSRILYSVTNNDIEDMVTNMDVSQWKYIVKAINRFVPTDSTRKNELLVQLGDRILESGDRQNAIAVYFSANSIDKVASIWLKELPDLEDIIKQENKTVYEAHAECLTEFVERFTVFSSFMGESKISNQGLISKFMEFVDIASASGDFFLAESFLNILPDSNEDVKAEKERVLLASGKSVQQTSSQRSVVPSTIQHDRYRNPHASNIPIKQPPQFPAAVGLPTVQPPIIPAQQAGAPSNSTIRPVKTTFAPKANPYAPPTVTSAPNPNTTNNVFNSTPGAPISSSSFIPPKNPYAIGTQTSEIPQTTPFVLQQSIYEKPMGASSTETPQSGIISGQMPHLNQKANNGWNDLPLKVKENKPSRARAVSVAPASVSIPPGSSTLHSDDIPLNDFPARPPVNRILSASSMPTPPPPSGFKRKESLASMDKGPESSASTKPLNPYSPQINKPVPITQRNSPYSPTAGSVAPPIQSQVSQNVPINLYAPKQSTTMPNSNISTGASPSNPYSVPPPSSFPPTGTAAAPPPISKQTIAPPPPMSARRKVQHKVDNITNATSLLESVQRTPSTTNMVQQQHHVVPSPVGSQPSVQASPVAATESSATVTIPEDQQDIIDFLKSELERVTPLIPKEYSKQLKDCAKRLKILYGHMERQDLLTQPTVDKLKKIVEYLKNKQYAEAMKIHVDIATNNAQEGGNWLTGVKRLIGIAEATAN